MEKSLLPICMPQVIFGYEPILENSAYTESAVALEDSEVVVIPRHDFLTLLHGHPELTRTFISMLCKSYRKRSPAPGPGL